MEKAKINSMQLFSLLVIFEFGTALVVPLGMDAKQDAWLAVLLGAFGGILLYMVYYYLFQQHPNLPLTSSIQKILGKFFGWPLGLLYIVFFIYGGSRDLRDVGSLLVVSAYDRTPLFVINAIILFSVGYVIYKGIEVMARTGEIMLQLLFILGFLGFLLVLSSGIIDINHLLPVLGAGWKPVITAAFPQQIMFPFGEAICFMMIFPYLNKPKSVLKAGTAALILSGLILSVTIATEISVLGAEFITRSTFPLLMAISKINIGEFIQRMDAIAVFTLIITDFFKVAIFFYAATVGLADLFNIPKYQKLIIPVGLLILFSSMTIASSFTEHLKEGKLALYNIYPLFAAGIPFLMLVVVLIRNLLGSKKTPS